MFRINHHPSIVACCLLALTLTSAETGAQAWRVSAASASSGIRPPGFPADVSTFASQQMSAAGTMSLRLVTGPASGMALWTQVPASLNGPAGMRVIARLDVSDGTGPGRTGAEAGHVFSTLWYEDYSARTPLHIFAGIAGAPSQTGSVGLWLNDGTSNRELARGSTDGPLGPNLGPNITLVSTTGGGNRALGRIQMLPSQALVLDAQLDTQAGRRDVILRKPLSGSFSPCALEGSADPSVAPGVSAPNADQFIELNGLAQSPNGELFTFGQARLFVLSPNRVGIWRVCQGNPSGRALTGNLDVLGPGIPGAPLAEFLFFSGELMPIGGGQVLFEARARIDSSSSTSPFLDAVFLNDGVRNRPMVARAESGSLGPGIANHAFSGFTSFRGERIAALLADVRETGSIQDRRGLWRLWTDRPAEPLALAGASGTLAPATGDVWLDFDDAVALANGDIIAVATSRPEGVNTRAVWRFRPGRAPQRLFGPGDSVAYRDQGGVDRVGVVDRVDQLVGSQLSNYAGDEGWINAEGQILVQGRIQGNPSTLTFQNGEALLDRDRLLRNGFEP